MPPKDKRPTPNKAQNVESKKDKEIKAQNVESKKNKEIKAQNVESKKDKEIKAQNVESKKNKEIKTQNVESNKDKEIKELLLRVEYLEKHMDLKYFQKTSGSGIVEEGQLELWQGAFERVQKELILLKKEKGLPSPDDRTVPGTDEPSRLEETIDTLRSEISKKDKAIVDIQKELDKANSSLDEMKKQLSDNRTKLNTLNKKFIEKDTIMKDLESKNNRLYRDIPKVLSRRHSSNESPRNPSPKSQTLDDNTSAKLAAFKTQSKDSEIKILKEKITQLKSTALRDPQSYANIQEKLREKDETIDKLNKAMKSKSQSSDGNITAKQSKDSEMRILEENNTKLESTALRESQSYAEVKEEMRKKDESIDKLNEEFKSIRKQLEEKNSEIQRVLDERNLQLKRLREDHDSKLQSLQREKDNEVRLKQKWIDKVQELENKSERSKSAKDRSDSLKVLLKDKDTEIRNKSDEIKQLKTKIQELENTCHEAFVKLDNKDKERKKLEDDLRRKLDEKDITINKLQQEKTMGTTVPVQTNIENLQRNFRKATEEIEELKLRLSKMVGENLTNNNPNITDLSDENRPTKLAEIYSEIYDNEWTDAFEEGEKQGKKEDTIIQELLEILQTSEQYCREKAEEYLRYLKESASKLHAKASFQSGYTKDYLLKELRKSYAPSFVNEVFSLFIKDKKKKISKAPQLEAYTKSCIRLCWLMSVQDPQVVLDVVKVPIQFDGDRYETYTRSGTTMEYVVWPSMLLHIEGPILIKGIAQGK